jgi:hypothetical protein
MAWWPPIGQQGRHVLSVQCRHLLSVHCRHLLLLYLLHLVIQFGVSYYFLSLF